MKIALLNGSPKANGGNSGYLLQRLQKLLNGGHVFLEYQISRIKEPFQAAAELSDCDALVFSLPLYVDSLPSHALAFLETLEVSLRNGKPVVYALFNCGFWDGRKNAIAVEIMHNWAARSGLTWGGALASGGGEMLVPTKTVPMGHGPNKNIGRALKALAANIKTLQSAADVYIHPNVPGWLFEIMANSFWRVQARRNGLNKQAMLAK